MVGVAAVTLAVLTLGFDITILNVALPTIAADLGVTTADLQWMVNAYHRGGHTRPDRIAPRGITRRPRYTTPLDLTEQSWHVFSRAGRRAARITTASGVSKLKKALCDRARPSRFCF